MTEHADIDHPGRTRNATALFREAVKEHPVKSVGGLVLEYGMFASGLFLAAALYSARVPLSAVDRALGLKLRERCVDLLARLSPG
jgi:hypothetical protein